MRRPRWKRPVPAPLTVCRQRRKAMNLTQGQLAARAGIPQPYVSDIELQKHDVRPDDLAAVAKILGCAPDELRQPVSA